MRVVLLNPTSTTATLQCIISGTSIRAHLVRVRFIKKPLTYGLMKDWERVLRQEIGYFEEGLVYRPTEQDSASLSSRIGKTMALDALFEVGERKRHMLDCDDNPEREPTPRGSEVAHSSNYVLIIVPPATMTTYPRSALSARSHQGVVVHKQATIQEVPTSESE